MAKKLFIAAFLIFCCLCTLCTASLTLALANMDTIMTQMADRYPSTIDKTKFTQIKDVKDKRLEIEESINTKLGELEQKVYNNEPLTIEFTEQEMLSFYLEDPQLSKLSDFGVDFSKGKMQILLPMSELLEMAKADANNPTADFLINLLARYVKTFSFVITLTSQNGQFVASDLSTGNDYLDSRFRSSQKQDLLKYLERELNSAINSSDIVKVGEIEFADNSMIITYKIV